VYAAARRRGMDFVTISDHNTLNGSLAIAHLPGTFLSTEFDTWFPEDGIRVHVVALGIDERAFAEAERSRASVHDLVACLREAGVVHYLAHPLFDMSGALSADTVERMLLLFNVLEGRNGARVSRCNGLLRDIVATLTPEMIAEMAARQGIEPYGETPWRKALVGGSDDHSSLFVADAYTIAAGDGTVEGFLAAVARGDCEAAGSDGDARLLAHSIYTPAFWKLREILRLDEPVPRPGPLKLIRKGFGRIGRDVPLLEKTVRGVRSIVPGLYRDGDGRGPAWEALLEGEIGALLATPGGLDSVDGRELNRRIFTVAQWLADDVTNLHLQPLIDPSVHVGAKRWLQSAFGVGMVHFLQLPYFIAWSIQSRDRASQERLREYFLAEDFPDQKVAVFTDGFESGDATSVSIRQLAQTATERGVTGHIGVDGARDGHVQQLGGNEGHEAGTRRGSRAHHLDARADRRARRHLELPGQCLAAPGARCRSSPRRTPDRGCPRLPRGERLHGYPREHRRRYRPRGPHCRQAAARAHHGHRPPRCAPSRRAPLHHLVLRQSRWSVRAVARDGARARGPRPRSPAREGTACRGGRRRYPPQL
jgi:hypothetical protein